MSTKTFFLEYFETTINKNYAGRSILTQSIFSQWFDDGLDAKKVLRPLYDSLSM